MPARPRPSRILLCGLVAAGLTAGLTLSAVPADAAPKPKTYQNCTELNRVYPHGVGRKGAKDKTSGKRVTTFTVSDAVYKLNTKSDRDKDGIACEKR